MVKILIADDHVIVRDALQQLCEGLDGYVVAGTAATGAEVLGELARQQFDLILLDLSMPDVCGCRLIEHIHAKYPGLPMLVFSMHNESHVARSVLRAGASGYVAKGSPREVLSTALAKIVAGDRYVDPLIAVEMMLENPEHRSVSAGEKLSGRELQILIRLAQGKAGNDIAHELFISFKTVSTYKTRLMQKMNFRSTADLVLYAVKHGLIESRFSGQEM